MLTPDALLAQLFPAGCEVTNEEHILYGEGRTAAGPVAVIGTADTAIGVAEVLTLSRHFLEVIENHPGRPIVMLVDNSGQKMALTDELLGLNQYIAHLVQLQDLARRRGHAVVALVYGNSIAGGFIAFGLGAGHTYALPDAETSVMKLPAIARVTKLPPAYLEELSRSVAVFAPGVENFHRTGGLEAVWREDLPACLEAALRLDQGADRRAETGRERGGRPLAAEVRRRVLFVDEL